LGFDFAADPYAELGRVVRRSSFQPRDLEHPEWNTHTLWGMNLAVCPKPLTSDLTTLSFVAQLQSRPQNTPAADSAHPCSPELLPWAILLRRHHVGLANLPVVV